MQVRCLHGYFQFRESAPGQIGRFASLFAGLKLIPLDDYFTFTDLELAPTYSIEGGLYLNATAIKTYEGKPWDVMRANDLVYNFNTGKVVSIDTVTHRVDLTTGANYFLSPGLILPGSVTADGSSVTDYAAWYLFDSHRFKYSGVISV